MTIVEGRQAIADIIGTSTKAISDWTRDGFPVAKRGRTRTANTYDTAEVIAWLIQREVARLRPEGARERLWRAQAEAAEAENAVRRRQLIPAAQLEPAMRAAAINAREWLLNVASRLSGALVGLDRESIEQRIAAEHDTFLHKLSRLHVAQRADAEDAAEEGDEPA